jgi:hypothetical protein
VISGTLNIRIETVCLILANFVLVGAIVPDTNTFIAPVQAERQTVQCVYKKGKQQQINHDDENLFCMLYSRNLLPHWWIVWLVSFAQIKLN